ncbi:MAG: hypothetical protein ACOYOV_11080 [Bacteroidales bacterium]
MNTYIETTGVNGQNEPVYSIQELSKTDLLMIKTGLSFMKLEIVSSQNIDRHKLLPQLEKLKILFDTVKL